MVTTELGACEWFIWDLRRSNLIDRGQLDQVIGEFLEKNPRAEPPALAEYLVHQGILTQFQADLDAGTLPDFAWIGPNLCHSAHDCSLKCEKVTASSRPDAG